MNCQRFVIKGLLFCTENIFMVMFVTVYLGGVKVGEGSYCCESKRCVGHSGKVYKSIRLNGGHWCVYISPVKLCERHWRCRMT